MLLLLLVVVALPGREDPLDWLQLLLLVAGFTTERFGSKKRQTTD